jgi:hypothetical protein
VEKVSRICGEHSSNFNLRNPQPSKSDWRTANRKENSCRQVRISNRLPGRAPLFRFLVRYVDAYFCTACWTAVQIEPPFELGHAFGNSL